VVVAGGGVAALEFVLALNDPAADRVAITIVAPDVDFIYRPPSSADPPSSGTWSATRSDASPMISERVSCPTPSGAYLWTGTRW
jgi:hypothetical protein